MNLIDQTNTKVNLMNTLSVIIPCFNEAENLFFVLDEIQTLIANHLSNLEIIFIQNGSTDQTPEILSAFEKQHPAICKIVEFKSNIGFSEGVLAGIKQAKGDVLCWTHADGQTPISDVAKAYEILQKNPNGGLIKGKRINYDNYNRFISRTLDLIASFTLGIKLDQIYAQPKLFYTKDFSIDLRSNLNDIEIDLLLLYLARKKNINVIDIDVLFKKRIAGKSKVQGYNLFSKLRFIFKNIYSILKLKLIIK